jgi:hypothetical protein
VKRRPNWLAVRDTALFLGGFAGAIHETLLSGSDRPDLLILYAAMMGLPAFLESDRRRARTADKEGK